VGEYYSDRRGVLVDTKAVWDFSEEETFHRKWAKTADGDPVWERGRPKKTSGGSQVDIHKGTISGEKGTTVRQVGEGGT